MISKIYTPYEKCSTIVTCEKYVAKLILHNDKVYDYFCVFVYLLLAHSTKELFNVENACSIKIYAAPHTHK